jgi:hypothetical protein
MALLNVQRHCWQIIDRQSTRRAAYMTTVPLHESTADVRSSAGQAYRRVRFRISPTLRATPCKCKRLTT